MIGGPSTLYRRSRSWRVSRPMTMSCRRPAFASARASRQPTSEWANGVVPLAGSTGEQQSQRDCPCGDIAEVVRGSKRPRLSRRRDLGLPQEIMASSDSDKRRSSSVRPFRAASLVAEVIAWVITRQLIAVPLGTWTSAQRRYRSPLSPAGPVAAASARPAEWAAAEGARPPQRQLCPTRSHTSSAVRSTPWRAIGLALSVRTSRWSLANRTWALPIQLGYEQTSM